MTEVDEKQEIKLQQPYTENAVTLILTIIVVIN